MCYFQNVVIMSCSEIRAIAVNIWLKIFKYSHKTIAFTIKPFVGAKTDLPSNNNAFKTVRVNNAIKLIK